jgi:hypothetical protein
MAQIVISFVSRYAPIISFPVAVVLGIVGYNLESYFRKERKLSEKAKFESVSDQRDERLLQQITQNPSTVHKYSQQSSSVLDRNQACDLNKK